MNENGKRQHDSERHAVQDAQEEYAEQCDHREGELRSAETKQLPEVREVEQAEHRLDHDRAQRRLGQLEEERQREQEGQDDESTPGVSIAVSDHDEG